MGINNLKSIIGEPKTRSRIVFVVVLLSALIFQVMGLKSQNKQLSALINRQISKMKGLKLSQKSRAQDGVLLTGIGIDKEARMAIINDKICRPGDEVDGFVVVNILQDTVALQNKVDNQTKKFSLYTEQEKRQFELAKKLTPSL